MPPPKIGKFKVESASSPHLNNTFSYALTGCDRVRHLIEIYKEARKQTGKTKGRAWPHLSDILRAAVVLSHATLEQLLRDLLALEADWSKDFLQRIPLAGAKQARAEKFSLADLKEFGDRSVAELVQESVDEHLMKRSFTEVRDVVEVLTMCGIQVQSCEHHFGDLAALMERRHHIAHTADIDDETGRGPQITRSISAKQVERWHRTVTAFILELSFQPKK